MFGRRTAEAEDNNRCREALKAMGEFTIFECPDCGYRSRTIRWGVGTDDPRIRFLPAQCASCGIYTEVELTDRDILNETFACGDCGGAINFLRQVESFECPRCKSRAVRLHQKGYW